MFFITGLGNTLLLTAIGVAVGLVGGVLLVLPRQLMESSPSKTKMPVFKLRLGRTVVTPMQLLVWLCNGYVEIIRGTPILLQLYFFYLALPEIFSFLDLSKFACVALALSCNSAAYISEIIRSGIQAVDRGQTEAARSLGLSARQTMVRIVMPQAVKNILPSMVNEFASLLKESSLASTFFVGDLMTQYKAVSGATYLPLQPLVLVAIIYFICTFTLSKLVGKLETRMREGD
ncbi:MAG: amino acid ABC transporter permease [Oscillospiraceae bacterium]|nr:amino acid ABC transporter permease [Oscillospiraceae bacterium]